LSKGTHRTAFDRQWIPPNPAIPAQPVTQRLVGQRPVTLESAQIAALQAERAAVLAAAEAEARQIQQTAYETGYAEGRAAGLHHAEATLADWLAQCQAAWGPVAQALHHLADILDWYTDARLKAQATQLAEVALGAWFREHSEAWDAYVTRFLQALPTVPVNLQLSQPGWEALSLLQAGDQALEQAGRTLQWTPLPDDTVAWDHLVARWEGGGAIASLAPVLQHLADQLTAAPEAEASLPPPGESLEEALR